MNTFRVCWWKEPYNILTRTKDSFNLHIILNFYHNIKRKSESAHNCNCCFELLSLVFGFVFCYAIHYMILFLLVVWFLISLHSSENSSRVLSWKDRMNIALGAASGLNYLHQKKIVHRDMRPGNILITQNYEPLVMFYVRPSMLKPFRGKQNH